MTEGHGWRQRCHVSPGLHGDASLMT